MSEDFAFLTGVTWRRLRPVAVRIDRIVGMWSQVDRKHGVYTIIRTDDGHSYELAGTVSEHLAAIKAAHEELR